MGSPSLVIRIKTIQILTATLSNADKQLDSKALTSFEKIHGFLIMTGIIYILLQNYNNLFFIYKLYNNIFFSFF